MTATDHRSHLHSRIASRHSLGDGLVVLRQKVEEEEERISVVPVPMKNAPLPLPGMKEEKIELVDSGLELEGMDVTGSFEHPAGL